MRPAPSAAGCQCTPLGHACVALASVARSAGTGSAPVGPAEKHGNDKEIATTLLHKVTAQMITLSRHTQGYNRDE